MATKTIPQTRVAVTIPPLRIQNFELKLIGDSPLICHNWSDKARKQILDKQMKKASTGREAKDPERDFAASLYPLGNDRFGFPSIAFKSAVVDACSHVSDLTKVQARGAFHIDGEFVEIHGKPTPREDMVRVGMGAADIRFRGEFKKWSATLTVRYNADVLSVEQIVNLFNVAGFAIGIGSWRPQRDGVFGLFHVDAKGR
jgi:hypothetical protein